MTRKGSPCSRARVPCKAPPNPRLQACVPCGEREDKELKKREHTALGGPEGPVDLEAERTGLRVRNSGAAAESGALPLEMRLAGSGWVPDTVNFEDHPKDKL